MRTDVVVDLAHSDPAAGIRQLDTAAARTVYDIVVDVVIAALRRYGVGRGGLRYRTLVRPRIIVVVVRARVPQVHPLVPDTHDHVVVNDHAVQYPGRIVHRLVTVVIGEDADPGSDIMNIDMIDFDVLALAEDIDATLRLVPQHRVIFQLEAVRLRRRSRSRKLNVRTVFKLYLTLHIRLGRVVIGYHDRTGGVAGQSYKGHPCPVTRGIGIMRDHNGIPRLIIVFIAARQ